ncbi:hypothetical protein ACT3UA_11410 [Glutamicibacter sp. 363]|uniref:hypothetical protein n=1 Tax=Glutamicibacter sp. 363 TaxID=3457731 RepID=UPI0040335B53
MNIDLNRIDHTEAVSRLSLLGITREAFETARGHDETFPTSYDVREKTPDSWVAYYDWPDLESWAKRYIVSR